MLDLVRRHKAFFLVATALGLALRLLFVWKFRAPAGDTLIYGDIAKNWLQHGVYGRLADGEVHPTLMRLPGYPGFLAICFTLFGVEHYNAVCLVQVAIDVLTCFVVADIARRIISDRAARIAFLVAAICPFTANYVALVLTETLAIFFAALTLWCAVVAFESGRRLFWILCGLSIGASILLRPDGGILLVAVGLYIIFRLVLSFTPATYRVTQQTPARQMLIAGILVAVFAFAPLVPWTIRNWRTFHLFQPIAPRYANDPGEPTHPGFERWMNTWIVDYVSVAEVYWRLDSEPFDISKLPNRAFDSPAQREITQALFDAHNETCSLSPALDARFAQLADERVHYSPFRYYVTLPALRIADMWLRPRTEMIGITDRWWELHDDPHGSAIAIALGALNFAYIALALWAMLIRRPVVQYTALFLLFVGVRSLFLGTIENPEPRYTLEMFPMVFIFAAATLDSLGRRTQSCASSSCPS